MAYLYYLLSLWQICSWMPLEYTDDRTVKLLSGGQIRATDWALYETNAYSTQTKDSKTHSTGLRSISCLVVFFSADYRGWERPNNAQVNDDHIGEVTWYFGWLWYGQRFILAARKPHRNALIKRMDTTRSAAVCRLFLCWRYLKNTYDVLEICAKVS